MANSADRSPHMKEARLTWALRLVRIGQEEENTLLASYKLCQGSQHACKAASVAKGQQLPHFMLVRYKFVACCADLARRETASHREAGRCACSRTVRSSLTHWLRSMRA